MSENLIKTHLRTCNLCEAMCGLEIQYQGKEILRIKGDKKDVLSEGHICPKAVALQDIYKDPDRLKTPIKKTADGWVDISWKEAFDEVAEKILAVQEKHGVNAVGSYRGNPNVHNLGLMLFGGPFLRAVGSNQKYTATSVDQLPHHFASLMMFGHYLLVPIPDIDRSDFMLIMGANPAVSNGSIMTAPGFARRLKNLKKRGGRVVVIDPRFTETAKIADQHHFIKPGKDVLLLLSLLHVIFENNWADLGHLEQHIKGLVELKTIVTKFPPEVTEEWTGIRSDETRKLAYDFSHASAAVCYGRMGLSTQAFGTLCQWLVNVLNCVTANMDREGGAMFPLPALDVAGLGAATGKFGSFNKRQSRVEGLPEFTGEFPVSTLATEILTPGEGQIKAMITIAGNPVLSTPDGKRLDKALESLDFMVSIDIYLNETTRHADIILPTTTGLETAMYDLVFHQFAIRNTAKFSTPLFEKDENQKHDWEILKSLTKRLTQKDNDATDQSILDQMLQFSPYRDQSLSVATLKEHPHGMDFGPLKPQFPKRLFTKDKKIELVHPLFLEDVKRLETEIKNWESQTDDGSFILIGRRDLRSNNSWMHNSERLTKGAQRCVLLIHPQDAKRSGLTDGEVVRVRSSIGAVELPMATSASIRKGVVSIPHGWGHNRKGTRQRVAEKNPGVSINDLNVASRRDLLSGNSDFSGTPVWIEKINIKTEPQ